MADSPQRKPSACSVSEGRSGEAVAGPWNHKRLWALKVSVRGVVQGVGFRPFVHNLATALELKGFVLNSQEGVWIHVESHDKDRIQSFLNRLNAHAPPLAKIQSIEATPTEPSGFEEFTIRESLSEGGATCWFLRTSLFAGTALQRCSTRGTEDLATLS
ncbi:MAG: acylphosphatase [Thermodesulfobacteriota bacterium]